MSTDGRPMQDSGSANIGSSPDKNKEKKIVSSSIIYKERRLDIRERLFAENPFAGGKQNEQLAKEGGATTPQKAARSLQPAERGSRTSVPHSVGWPSAKRSAKCENVPQLQPPPAIPLQLLLLASGLQIPNQRNAPRNVQSTAESAQPVSAANYTRAVNDYGARRNTPRTFVTRPLLQLNTALLGAGFISSGEDPRTVGSLRVHSKSADGTEAGVHLNQSHLAAGFISTGSDSISSPHQRWRKKKLCAVAPTLSHMQSSSEASTASSSTNVRHQYAQEAAPTKQSAEFYNFNFPGTLPPTYSKLSGSAQPAALADPTNAAVGYCRIQYQQSVYDVASGGAHGREKVSPGHQVLVSSPSGSEFPSLPQQPWQCANLLERPDHLAQKFKHLADIHEEWTRGEEEMLQRQDFPQCRLSDVTGLKKKHEAFESDLVAHQDRVKEIAAIAQELNVLGYHEAASLNARCQLICDQWDRLGTLTQKRRSALEEAERALELDHLYHEFAKRAAPFNNWLDGARGCLVDMFTDHTTEEIQRLMDAHEEFKLILGGTEKEYKAIVGLAEEAQAIVSQYQVPGGVKNPYTTLTPQEITGKWSEVKQLVPKWDQVLQAELMRQQSNERLRRKFAEKANVVGPWIERQMAALAAFEVGMQGSLDEQLKRLHEYEQAAAQYQPHLEELEGTHQEVQEPMILENRYTQYTMETLRVGWHQLLTSIHSKVSNIVQELTNELCMSFNHLEKNSTARLTPEEFMSCQGDADNRPTMNIVEPNNTSCDHSDAVLDPMTWKSTDGETDEQIINCMKTIFGDKPYITAEELRREIPPDQAE